MTAAQPIWPTPLDRYDEPTVAAHFRDMYTRLLLDTPTGPGTVLGVTSAIEGEGKTTVATGLAATLARDGALDGSSAPSSDIILIDCAHHAAGAPEGASRGLLPYLRGTCGLSDAIRPTAIKGLWTLPSGDAGTDYQILIRRGGIDAMFVWLRERFRLIILDLPSTLGSTDMHLFTGKVDGILVAVRSGVTPADRVRQTLDALPGEKVFGVFLNDARRDLPAWLSRIL